MELPMTIGWSVAMVQPNAENRAILNLKRQEFDCYCPRFTEVIVQNGKKVSRSGPLFSRYVFVYIENAWSSILGTFGVTKLILNGDRPATVSESLIDELRTRSGDKGFIDLTEHETRHKQGDEVQVLAGPFYGFKGIYQAKSPKEREIVLLNMLGRSVRVELEPDQISGPVR